MEGPVRVLLGGLSGAAFGVAVALLAVRIGAVCTSRGGDGGVMAAMTMRMLLDAAALGAVFLLRHVLPLPFEATLIGTALGLSLTGMVMSWRLSRQIRRGESNKNTDTGGGA